MRHMHKLVSDEAEGYMSSDTGVNGENEIISPGIRQGYMNGICTVSFQVQKDQWRLAFPSFSPTFPFLVYFSFSSLPNFSKE